MKLAVTSRILLALRELALTLIAFLGWWFVGGGCRERKLVKGEPNTRD